MPKEKINSLFSASNVTNETDLVKLKKENPYLYQMAGENTKTANMKALKQAKRMFRSAQANQ